MITETANWLSSNHDSLEVVVWIVGLAGLWVAARQLIEGQNQRSISETFDLYERLNGALEIWHDCANSAKSNPHDRRKTLGNLLAIYELICDAINRGMLTNMSKTILTNQIIDSLKSVYRYPDTKNIHQFLCEDPQVCVSVKWFLIDNWRLSIGGHLNQVHDSFLNEKQKSSFGNSILKFINRRSQVILLRLSSR